MAIIAFILLMNKVRRMLNNTISKLFTMFQAANPIPPIILKKLALKENIRTAAVCVYPNRVKDAYEAIKLMNLTKEINIASGKYKNTFKYTIALFCFTIYLQY